MGRAFGLGPDLGRVIALDGYGRPYWLDLQDRTSAAASTLDLLGWLAPTSRQVGFSGQVTPTLALGLSLAANAKVASPENGHADYEIAKGFELAAEFGRARLRIVHDWGLQGHFGLDTETGENTKSLLSAPVFASPYLALTNGADGVELAQWVHETTTLRLAFVSDRLTPSSRGGGADVWIAEVIGRPSGAGHIAFQLGGALEERRLLGTDGEGALGMPPRSSTIFTGLAGTLHLDDGFEVFGQASFGFTEPGRSDGSLLKNVSWLRSSSFGVGIARRILFTPGDRVTVAVSQPLRVDAGAAVIDRPVGWTIDGHILRRSERITLQPEGREIDIELGYRLPLGNDASIELNWISQLEPGHRSVSPAHTAAIRWRAQL